MQYDLDFRPRSRKDHLEQESNSSRATTVSGAVDEEGIRLLEGVRGKFYRSGTKLNLPVYLDKEVLVFVRRIAERRKTDLSAIVNELIRNDMELADTITHRGRRRIQTEE